MKTTNCLTRITALAVIGVVAGVMSARADINMYLNGGGEYTASVGLTAPDGHVLNVGAAYLGEYGFTVSSVDSTISGLTGLTAGSTFNSVCLSPSGEVYFNTSYDFNYDTLSGAVPGLNPSGYWSPNGIQNAAYLWKEFGSTVANGDQGAGLALAMLEVLYNGGLNYGTLAANTTYAPNFGTDTAAQTAYNQYISFYESNGASSGSLGEAANTQTYGIFVPVSGSPAGQEFIFLSQNNGNITSVPEPTTLVSAALLLLPFGASTVRILRKGRMAS